MSGVLWALVGWDCACGAHVGNLQGGQPNGSASVVAHPCVPPNAFVCEVELLRGARLRWSSGLRSRLRQEGECLVGRVRVTLPISGQGKYRAYSKIVCGQRAANAIWWVCVAPIVGARQAGLGLVVWQRRLSFIAAIGGHIAPISGVWRGVGARLARLARSGVPRNRYMCKGLVEPVSFVDFCAAALANSRSAQTTDALRLRHRDLLAGVFSYCNLLMEESRGGPRWEEADHLELGVLPSISRRPRRISGAFKKVVVARSRNTEGLRRPSQVLAGLVLKRKQSPIAAEEGARHDVRHKTGIAFEVFDMYQYWLALRQIMQSRSISIAMDATRNAGKEIMSLAVGNGETHICGWLPPQEPLSRRIRFPHSMVLSGFPHSTVPENSSVSGFAKRSRLGGSEFSTFHGAK